MLTPKVTSLRKYIFEYCVLGLGGAVIFLFYQYASLNNIVRGILLQQTVEQQNVIRENTRTLDQVNNYFLINNQNKKQ